MSIPLKLIEVRDQTQRKQSSTPKPQSEFSANVWVLKPYIMILSFDDNGYLHVFLTVQTF